MTAPSARKILMTADTAGGVWTYALELTRSLREHGCEVLLATMGAPLSPGQRAEAAEIENLTVKESRFKLEWMENPWSDLDMAGQWLLELAAGFQPDIVHLNGYTHADLPWPAPVVVVAHSCVLSWWRAVKDENAPAAWNEYGEKVRRGIAAADLVIAPTHAMFAALRELYPRAIGRARVIPNARRAGLFRPRLKKNVIFSAGRLWDEAKNLSSLGRVAGALSWPVYVAGDGQHPNGASVSLGELHSLGRLDTANLARWYGEASIYCLPARYEPFGLSVLEAALAGCALVLGDIPSLRENWSDAAVFVPPDEDTALERALSGLISDGHHRASLRARATARASRFTPERMAGAYAEAYAHVLSATETLCA